LAPTRSSFSSRGRSTRPSGTEGMTNSASTERPRCDDVATREPGAPPGTACLVICAPPFGVPTPKSFHGGTHRESGAGTSVNPRSAPPTRAKIILCTSLHETRLRGLA
jgi:hypothetical protein